MRSFRIREEKKKKKKKKKKNEASKRLASKEGKRAGSRCFRPFELFFPLQPVWRGVGVAHARNFDLRSESLIERKLISRKFRRCELLRGCSPNEEVFRSVGRRNEQDRFQGTWTLLPVLDAGNRSAH